jgi:hypothetical protein
MSRLPLAFSLAVLGTVSAGASDYDERRAADVRTCRAIDPAASQSGLYFNPEGYRSYYLRSHCFQEAAVRFRDDTLCTQVKERHSILSSSWGYSATRCRALVTEAMAADRLSLQDLKRQYLNAPVTLRDFRIERNGNGRDFDLLPTFAGDKGAGYTLKFEIIPPDATKLPIRFHASGYYVDGHANLQIFLRREDIERQVPGFVPDHRYAVRATLMLAVPIGTGDARWNDAFAEGVFPARERSQSITKDLEFPAPLPRRPPIVNRQVG